MMVVLNTTMDKIPRILNELYPGSLDVLVPTELRIVQFGLFINSIDQLEARSDHEGLCGRVGNRVCLETGQNDLLEEF